MLGILVILAISWLLLYLFQKQHLWALGLRPNARQGKMILLGFVVTASLCVLDQLLEAFLKSAAWQVSETTQAMIILEAIYWDIKSVVTEELLFRGALLYILIQRIGVPKSVLLSGIAFGVYHWFSYGVLGSPWAMLFVFIGTGLMGYAWALAFAKSKTILLPIALHLGWNVVYNTFFSQGPLGELVFVLNQNTALNGGAALIDFLSGMLIIPILVLLFVIYGVKKTPATNLKSV